MTPERWQKLKELCHLALECDPTERNSFLEKACLGDDDLRRDAESMIARATSGGGVLDGPIWKDLLLEGAPVDQDATTARTIPQIIGRYRILRVVGEGGMGVVYEAEQDHPRRHVALKVILPGLTSTQTLRRFDRESQALARLHHVGIAQIYEAGSAETGSGPQPYFAMEFIHGTPLREYAASHKLATQQRLELMAKICEAVQHAHENGIIHRDLKPGNILVDKTGQPKILDFGVARLTDSEAQLTRQTDIGQLVGTLAYMSPEQVLADPGELDNRSDVYALGVILYELLGNRLPYEISNKLHEAVRTIREEEPKRLSSISREFRGDVETIVAKALEKDKSRRYASAAAMLGDIRKHLANKPITARPPSTVYQLQKFAQRHKTLVGATVVVFAVLVAGIIVSAQQAVKARRAEQVSEAVNAFLMNDLLAQASANKQSGPNTKPDPDLKVRTALDRAAARITGKFDRQPEVEAAIRQTIGQTYSDLGLYKEARTQLEQALQLQRRILGPEDRKTLRTLNDLASAAYLQGEYVEADGLLTQALDVERRVLGPEDPVTLSCMYRLANDYYEQGKHAQSEALQSKTLEIRRRVLGPEHRDTLASMQSLALVYYLEGKNPDSEAMFKDVLEKDRRILGPEHPTTLSAMNFLAMTYSVQGKYPQAEQVFRETLDLRRRVLGPEHSQTLSSMHNLAHIYGLEGRYRQAEGLLSETLEIQRRVLGPKHASTLMSMETLARLHGLLGEYAQAEALFTETLEIQRQVLGPEHPDTILTLSQFAEIYQLQGNYLQAGNYAEQAWHASQRAFGPDRVDTIEAAADLALAYISQKRFREAEPLARDVAAFYRSKQPDDWERFRAESLLGASLAGQKKFDVAEPLLVQGYQGMETHKSQIEPPESVQLEYAHKWLVQLYRAWGKPEKAIKWAGNNGK